MRTVSYFALPADEHGTGPEQVSLMVCDPALTRDIAQDMANRWDS